MPNALGLMLVPAAACGEGYRISDLLHARKLFRHAREFSPAPACFYIHDRHVPWQVCDCFPLSALSLVCRVIATSSTSEWPLGMYPGASTEFGSVCSWTLCFPCSSSAREILRNYAESESQLDVDQQSCTGAPTDDLTV